MFTSGVSPHRAGRKSLFRPAGVKLAFPDMTAPDSGEPPAAGPLDYVVRPFRRAGRYYARSWRDYLDRRAGSTPHSAAHPRARCTSVPRRNRPARLPDVPTRQRHACVRTNQPRSIGGARLLRTASGGWTDPKSSSRPAGADRRDRPAGQDAADIPTSAWSSTAGTRPRRANRAVNGGWAIPPTAASTRCSCATRQPRPWLVCVHGAVMGRGRARPHAVPCVASARGSRPQCGAPGAADARPTCARTAPGCGIPGRGRARRRPRRGSGGVGLASAAGLDPHAGTRLTDRPEQHLPRWLHRIAGRQPRGRPYLRDTRRPGRRYD